MDVSIVGVAGVPPPLYVQLSHRVIYHCSIGGTGWPIGPGTVLVLYPKNSVKDIGDYFNPLHAELPPSREWLSLPGHREWSSPPDWHHSAPQHPIAIVSYTPSVFPHCIYIHN